MIKYAFPFWQLIASPTRNVSRKMETVNMLKKYCGEEFAFYYLFLNNQIVALLIPVFFSLTLWGIDLYHQFINPEYVNKSSYNIWYGLFIAV